jgi:hypothetical protein
MGRKVFGRKAVSYQRSAGGSGNRPDFDHDILLGDIVTSEKLKADR